MNEGVYSGVRDFEGFGLVITEALQSAAVPLAYDTFASLHDIISDGKNGYIIPDGDRKAYADKLQSLMADTETRRRMAEEGLLAIDKFDVENITKQWNQLFESL